MGFGDECTSKLKENIDDADSVFQRINRCFDKLPLAATIEGVFLCVHGGIGSTLKTIADIDAVARPL
jgi:protein phosphatase